MSISKIKEDARISLSGKWGKGIGILFAYFAFSFVLSFVGGVIAGLVGEESIVAALIELVIALLEVPLTLGLGYAYIKLKRNEDVKAFDFVNLAFSNFGRAWKIGLREVLKMLLPMVLLIVSLFVIIGAGVYSTASSMLGATAEPSLGLILVGFVLYIVSLIWLVVRSLLYALTINVAYDNPDMKSLEVVNESARIMKGNRGKYFLLSLSFAVWFLIPVAMIAFGLAVPAIIVLLALCVWLEPYMQVAYVCFYDELVGKDTNNNIENNTESNDEAITEM